MKVHLSYIALTLCAAASFYFLGQYVGLYKMRAHAYVLDQSAAQPTKYKFGSIEAELENCKRRSLKGNLSFFPDYEWYRTHWSSKFPDVSNIDAGTESIYKLMENK